jgi:hypothetical protein
VNYLEAESELYSNKFLDKVVRLEKNYRIQIAKLIFLLSFWYELEDLGVVSSSMKVCAADVDHEDYWWRP